MTHNERMAGLRHDRLQLLYANQIRSRRRIVREEWEAEQQGRMPHALL